MRFQLIEERPQRGNIKHYLARLQGLDLNGSISQIGSQYGEFIHLEIEAADTDGLCKLRFTFTPVDIWNKDRELAKAIKEETRRGELLEPNRGKRIDALMPLWNEKNHYFDSVVVPAQQEIRVRVSEESPDYVMVRIFKSELYSGSLRPVVWALIEAIAPTERTPETRPMQKDDKSQRFKNLSLGSNTVTASEPGEGEDDLETQIRRFFPKPMTEKRRKRLVELTELYHKSGHFLTQEQIAAQFGISPDTIRNDLKLLKEKALIETSVKTSV